MKMMKRIVSVILLAAMLLSMVACGGSAESEAPESKKPEADVSVTIDKPAATPAPAPSEKPIVVDENLLSVEVTFPASFFDETETEESIKAAAAEQGMKSCKVNDDGSVTYVMSKAKHKEVLDEYRQSILDTIDEMLNGDEAIASFLRIEHNDKMTQFDIYCDMNLYSAWDAFAGLGFFIAGAYYQIFDGIPQDEVDVVVNFYDDATGEQHHTMSYRDFVDDVAEETPAA